MFLLFFILISFKTTAQTTNRNFEKLEKDIIDQYGKDYSFSVIINIDSTIVSELNFNLKSGRIFQTEESDQLFNIASITKAITAVGVIKLAEQQLIDLDATISSYFDGLPSDKAEIKVVDLLVHKSGFAQSYPCEGIAEGKMAFQKIMRQKLIFAPGTSFNYSNQNYQLLALLIEKVSQTDYNSYIRKAVLEPLNMNSTFFWDEVSFDMDIADLPKKVRKSLGSKNWAWIGATGIFSNAHDLLQFWNGIFQDDFLSKASKDKLFLSYYQTSSGLGIGFGFYNYVDTKWHTPEIWTRGTESWGHNAVIRNFPDEKVTKIVLSNSGELGKEKITANRLISDKIADFIFE
jgi:CubicO group peptidase (beta-lactamase class C family)